MSSPIRLRVMLISTAHPADDQRIVGKIAPTLSQHYDVCLALPQQSSQQFDALSLPVAKHVWARIWQCYPRILLYFLKKRPQIVHIFMAELLPLAFVFRWLGAKVVYEVQENLYKKRTTKHYNTGWLYWKCFGFFDKKARQYFHLVFTENAYLQEYQQLAQPHALVQNFADEAWIEFISQNQKDSNSIATEFLYVGVVCNDRSHDVMLQAIEQLIPQHPNIKLHLFGRLHGLPKQPSTRNLCYYGHLPQAEAFALAEHSVAGIALLKPVGDYTESYPTKIFDYMALGLPVITSHFGLYERVIVDHKCGFCIDPSDPDTLAQTMDWLIKNPEEAKKMGCNGQKAVQKHYNWAQEGKKLLDLYDMVTKTTTASSRSQTPLFMI